jgi:hypothetical protein
MRYLPAVLKPRTIAHLFPSPEDIVQLDIQENEEGCFHACKHLLFLLNYSRFACNDFFTQKLFFAK